MDIYINRIKNMRFKEFYINESSETDVRSIRYNRNFNMIYNELVMKKNLKLLKDGTYLLLGKD